MGFFKSILLCGLIAGVVAGFALTALQTVKVYPLIFAAEEFEDTAHDHGSHDHGDAKTTPNSTSKPATEAKPWMPADGIERLFYSLLSNILLGVGLGLVLAAIFALRDVENWRQGAIWGLAGFIAVNLAPALGIPPELPGMPSGALLARQTWWLTTALCTGAGIALIFLTANLIWRVAGAALIALPQIYGAPHPDSVASDVPATLAADFATASLATNLIFWAILGILAAEVMSRLDRNKDARPA